MICRCLSCNKSTHISLRRGVQISDYRCSCGGILKKATRINLNGEHPADSSRTMIHEYGAKKGCPYFGAYKSDGFFFYKIGNIFHKI